MTPNTTPTKLPNFFFPYSPVSRGCRDLAMKLGVKRARQLFREIDTFNNPPADVLINWGSGSIGTEYRACARRIINPVSAVNKASNKIKFFTAMQEADDGPRIPEFTTVGETAFSWMDSGAVVMGRQSRGKCGIDIAFFNDDPDKFNESEFWVQYKKKKHEFRVHIVDGNVISLQRKALRSTDYDGNPIDPATVDFRIRNHRNGFIFQREGLNVPDDVIVQAKKAVTVLGLDFGAVDVIFNEHESRAYVLEINTAPGLEGTTLTDYTKAFKESFGV